MPEQIEPQQLERLQRAAYSRDATDADREALAAALTLDPAPAEPEHATVYEDQELAPDSADQEAEPAHERFRRRWLAPLALISALLVGGFGGYLLRHGTATPPTSVLERWETLPPAQGDPGHFGLENPDSRILGSINEGQFQFIGTVGSPGDFYDGQFEGDMVCLTVIETGTEGSGGSCNTREIFLESGIGHSSDAGGNRLNWYWPPDGPPGVVTCPHWEWPAVCPTRD